MTQQEFDAIAKINKNHERVTGRDLGAEGCTGPGIPVVTIGGHRWYSWIPEDT